VGAPIVVNRLRDRRQPASSWESPVCEGVSPGAEERALLENVTQQRNGDLDWEHQSVFDSDL
jgi:hypothetical protein